MRWGLRVVGVLASLIGLLWIGQGLGYVGGSFITPKPEPNDVDCCFDYAHHLDWPRLAAADLLSTANDCAAQRARYGCEFHIANMVIGLFGPIQVPPSVNSTGLRFGQVKLTGPSAGPQQATPLSVSSK